jgi:hypothetical protein
MYMYCANHCVTASGVQNGICKFFMLSYVEGTTHDFRERTLIKASVEEM